VCECFGFVLECFDIIFDNNLTGLIMILHYFKRLISVYFDIVICLILLFSGVFVLLSFVFLFYYLYKYEMTILCRRVLKKPQK